MFENLPPILKVCTDREAINFGIFLLAILTKLEYWRATEQVNSAVSLVCL